MPVKLSAKKSRRARRLPVGKLLGLGGLVVFIAFLGFRVADLTPTAEQLAAVPATGGSVRGVTPSITVLSPNGREFLALDAPYRIKWQTTGRLGMVKIEWLEAGSGRVGTIDIGEASRGFYDWTPTAAAGLMAGRSYTIIVSSYTNTNLQDQSDAPFVLRASVAEVPTVTVVTPAPGEAWFVDSRKSFTWSTSNVAATAPMNIRLINATSGQITDVLRRVPNTGAATWIVGRAFDGSRLPAGKYRVRICVAGLLGNCDKAANDGYLELKSKPRGSSTLGASVVQSFQTLRGKFINF